MTSRPIRDSGRNVTGWTVIDSSTEQPIGHVERVPGGRYAGYHNETHLGNYTTVAAASRAVMATHYSLPDTNNGDRKNPQERGTQ